ncbi:MAG TPA: hypothetical protein VGH99_13520 [Pseudonocardia sp.]|jgi:ABC-type transport system involved in multi-copper enzyme maturation permease subunit
MSAPATPAGPTEDGRGAWSAAALGGLAVAEVRKTLSTHAWWVLLVAAAAITLLSSLVTAEIGGLAFTASMAQATTLSGIGTKFTVLFGVVSAASEYRHRTITTSYLTASGRPQLVVAKAAVAAAVGAVYGVVCAIAGVLGVLFGGGQFDSEFGAVLGVSLAAVLLYALWAALGVGIGTLVNNQLAAIVGVLIYLILVEQILVLLARAADLGQIDGYLPAGASEAVLTGLAGEGPFGGLFSTQTLPWGAALLIFAGYTAAALLAGVAVAQRRDIT